MSWFWVILIGTGTGTFGSSIPGLLNTSILQITIQHGREQATKFIGGALIIIFIQTFLSIYFARFINKNPYVSDIINEVGIAVFIVLSIYFFTKKSKKDTQKISQTKIRQIMSQPFFYGVVLATLNVFNILFYVFLSLSLRENNLFDFSLISMLSLTLGVSIGAYLAFSLYLWLGQQKKINDFYIMQKIYPILGIISLIIAGINVLKVIQ